MRSTNSSRLRRLASVSRSVAWSDFFSDAHPAASARSTPERCTIARPAARQEPSVTPPGKERVDLQLPATGTPWLPNPRGLQDHAFARRDPLAHSAAVAGEPSPPNPDSL